MYHKSQTTIGRPSLKTATPQATTTVRAHRNSTAGLLTTKSRTFAGDDLTVQSQFSTASAAAIDRDLLASGISEKDLEIEHLMTQLVALTEKADVVEDMRKDVHANKGMLQESESKRGELQDKIMEQGEAAKESHSKESKK